MNTFKINALTRTIRCAAPFFFAGAFSLNAMAESKIIDAQETAPSDSIFVIENGSVTISTTGQLTIPESNEYCLFDVDAAEWNFTNNGKVVSTASEGDHLIHIRLKDGAINPVETAGNYKIINTGNISLTGSGQDLLYSSLEEGVSAVVNLDITNSGSIENVEGSLFTVESSDKGGTFKLNNEATGVISSLNNNAINDLNPGDTVTIDNAGEISSGKVAINSTGKTTIFNSGKISGATAISLAGKNDILKLDVTSDITGTVKAGEGTDSLILLGKTGTGNIADISKYKDFESLIKEDNSTWIVKGVSAKFRDGTTVKAGNLLLGDTNSTLTSNVTVNSGATFGGYGIVKGNVLNSGTLALASAAPGMASREMSNFTIDGNYVGDNGNLILNMALNDDTTSPGSNLIVKGDTSGTTNVMVNNVGGMGKKTIEGIQVIEVGGKSDGVFVQKERIVAGAYDYYLVKGKVSNSEDGNWYLTSSLTDDPSTDPDNEPLPTPGPSPSPSRAGPVRVEAGSYLGNQAAAKDMFMSTLHDRMGEQNFTQSLSSDDFMPSTWMRISGSRTEGHVASTIDQSIDSGMFQLGNDLTTWSSTGSDRGHFGFLFGSGYAKTSSRSSISPEGRRHSEGKARGYNLGLYGTWYQEAKDMAGLYIDASLQYSWFDNETKGEGLAIEKYDSDLWQASLETGYSFQVNNDPERALFVEPQAQIIYTAMSTDDFREHGGAYIHDNDADGYITRLGTRFFGRFAGQNVAVVQPFLEVNWWHDTAANAFMMNEDKIYSDTPASYYEVKGGVEGKISNQLHTWVNVGYQAGKNDYSQITGMAGIKYIW